MSEGKGETEMSLICPCCKFGAASQSINKPCRITCPVCGEFKALSKRDLEKVRELLRELKLISNCEHQRQIEEALVLLEL